MPLKIGDVFYRWINFKESPHHKFFVLVAFKPKRFFFINSKISKFIIQRPHLASQQVVVPSETHLFLDYDSYANCTATIDTSEIRNGSDFHQAPENDRCGCVTLDVLELIYEAVRINETIEEETREDIENQLAKELGCRRAFLV